MPPLTNAKVLVGIDTADDAGVYFLNETTALIQTVDFFTPIVDDPYMFGQIAAANSLSDIYAMGGQPLTVLNIVAFPLERLPGWVLTDILRGGRDKVAEAGAVLLGGHTVADSEPKYGLSVTGIAHPAKIWRNAGAKNGDALVLTKPLGTGILATAAKAGLFVAGVAAAAKSMATLNAASAAAAAAYDIHACTDITGFGLLGHLAELVCASGVAARIDSKVLPFLLGAEEAAVMGLVPGGAYANRKHLTLVSFADTVPEAVRDLCYDPQTSGGLLFSLPACQAEKLVQDLQGAGNTAATIIGQVIAVKEQKVCQCGETGFSASEKERERGEIHVN